LGQTARRAGRRSRSRGLTRRARRVRWPALPGPSSPQSGVSRPSTGRAGVVPPWSGTGPGERRRRWSRLPARAAAVPSRTTHVVDPLPNRCGWITLRARCVAPCSRRGAGATSKASWCSQPASDGLGAHAELAGGVVDCARGSSFTAWRRSGAVRALPPPAWPCRTGRVRSFDRRAAHSRPKRQLVAQRPGLAV
jgi:hypothetical protein